MTVFALAVFLAVSAPAAFAQVDTTEAKPLVEDPMETMEPAANQTPGQSIDALNYTNVVWAMENTGAGIDEFSALADPTVDNIHIVDASTFVGEGDLEDFDSALASSAVTRSQLHDAIDDNDLLERAFDENNVEHETAVGIDVLDDGSIVIFYYDPMSGQ